MFLGIAWHMAMCLVRACYGRAVSSPQYSIPLIILQTPETQGMCLTELLGPIVSSVTILGHSGPFMKERSIPSSWCCLVPAAFYRHCMSCVSLPIAPRKLIGTKRFVSPTQLVSLVQV